MRLKGQKLIMVFFLLTAAVVLSGCFAGNPIVLESLLIRPDADFAPDMRIALADVLLNPDVETDKDFYILIEDELNRKSFKAVNKNEVDEIINQLG